MTALADAVGILAELDPADVAGCLTSTKVPDQPTPADAFRTRLIAEGFDGSLVPAKRREALDFANACRSIETRRGAAKGERVAVGEVLTNSTETVYQITREIVDAQNRVIDHAKGMRVVLRPDAALTATDPITTSLFDDSHALSLKHLEDQIRARYFALRGTLPGAKVRAILRELFKGMSATRWSSANSVWFVPTEHATKLEGIERVLKATYGTDCEFDTIPLPNTKGVRNLVREKVGNHSAADATKLMAEIAKKLQGDQPVRESTFNLANKQARELHEYAQRMEAMLGGEVEAVRASMALVDQQLMEMWGRVQS